MKKALKKANIYSVLLITTSIFIFQTKYCKKKEEKLKIIKRNSPPKIIRVEFPERINSNERIEFKVTVDEREGEKVSARFDWGDGQKTKWTKFASPEEKIISYHSYKASGIYNIKIEVKDKSGNISQIKFKIDVDPQREEGKIKWSFKTGGFIYSTPAISEDRIYIGSDDGKLYVLDKKGNLIWSFDAGEKIRSSPSVDENGTIYFGALNGKFYALDKSGKVKWEITTTPNVWICSSPAIGNDRTIYFGADDGKFYAVDTDGRIRWNFPTGGYVWPSPAIDKDGTIYFASRDKKIYAVDKHGKLKWSFETQGEINSSPIISNGKIYVASFDGYLYKFDKNGKLISTYKVGDRAKMPIILGPQRYEGDFRPIISSPVIDEEGNIFIASFYGKIFKIKADGKMEKVYNLNEIVYSTPTITEDGIIYIGTYETEKGSIYAIDTKKKTVIWKITIGERIVSSPAVDEDGTIYIGAFDGNIYAIEGKRKIAKSEWPTFRKDSKHSGRLD